MAPASLPLAGPSLFSWPTHSYGEGASQVACTLEPPDGQHATALPRYYLQAQDINRGIISEQIIVRQGSGARSTPAVTSCAHYLVIQEALPLSDQHSIRSLHVSLKGNMTSQRTTSSSSSSVSDTSGLPLHTAHSTALTLRSHHTMIWLWISALSCTCEWCNPQKSGAQWVSKCCLYVTTAERLMHG